MTPAVVTGELVTVNMALVDSPTDVTVPAPGAGRLRTSEDRIFLNVGTAAAPEDGPIRARVDTSVPKLIARSPEVVTGEPAMVR